MKINLITTLFSIAIGTGSIAQNVNIPDANFKAYLVGNTAINTNSDSEIQESEAQAFSGTINAANLNISDLTGIEAFINIQQLFCNNNNLTSLDLSQNVYLINVYCEVNQIQSLDVSQNSALGTLVCRSNQLTSITFGTNPNLGGLYCQQNQLTSIDLSNLPGLSTLNIANNPISSIDLSTNSNLYSLVLANNNISSIDLNSNNNLVRFYCENLPITSLDLSNNTLLTDIYCFNTNISSLNIANGANELIYYLWIQDNPNLTCVQVDDQNYSTTNWINGDILLEDPYIYDPGLNFSEDCASLGISSIQSIESIEIYPNPASDVLNVSLNNSESLELLNINGLVVYRSNQAFEHAIDIYDFKSGIYFILTSSGETKKVIINN